MINKNYQLYIKQLSPDRPTLFTIKSETLLELWPKNNYLNSMDGTSNYKQIPHVAYFDGEEFRPKVFIPSTVSFGFRSSECVMSFSNGRHRALWLIEQGVKDIPLDISNGVYLALSKGIATVAKDLYIDVTINEMLDSYTNWCLVG